MFSAYVLQQCFAGCEFKNMSSMGTWFIACSSSHELVREDVFARVAFSACVRLGGITPPCCCCWWAPSVRPRVPPLSCRPEGGVPPPRRTHAENSSRPKCCWCRSLAWGGVPPTHLYVVVALQGLHPVTPPQTNSSNWGGVPPPT